jgi:hypothetical protein
VTTAWPPTPAEAHPLATPFPELDPPRIEAPPPPVELPDLNLPLPPRNGPAPGTRTGSFVPPAAKGPEIPRPSRMMAPPPLDPLPRMPPLAAPPPRAYTRPAVPAAAPDDPFAAAAAHERLAPRARDGAARRGSAVPDTRTPRCSARAVAAGRPAAEAAAHGHRGDGRRAALAAVAAPSCGRCQGGEPFAAAPAALVAAPDVPPPAPASGPPPVAPPPRSPPRAGAARRCGGPTAGRAAAGRRAQQPPAPPPVAAAPAPSHGRRSTGSRRGARPRKTGARGPAGARARGEGGAWARGPRGREVRREARVEGAGTARARPARS